MLSFLHTPVPRTRTATQNPVVLSSAAAGNGPVTMEFTASAKNKVMRLTLPAGPGLALPPPHFHRHQNETFNVISGRMLAVSSHLLAERMVLIPQESITIPAGAIHRFENAADVRSEGGGDKLVIDLSMDPKDPVRDESFFRHFYGYLDDCGKAGRKPNFFQLMLFLWEADTILVLPLVPIAVSVWFVWFMGVVIGKWSLGLSHVYPEYHQK
ncbi:hypothetical protein K490DRAFT_42111 [Saccharata proteae CBS 121410]|uniref:Cupin type-2 domain-containing protein n=1 Tax=Saccharata proteae CBS 121410 TaxID=1314787 RepID=A0A9P4HW36_9PEZI|nr:hypothetical protein K490DRAFT_42111 [Saccharata proteae CBS 121410]